MTNRPTNNISGYRYLIMLALVIGITIGSWEKIVAGFSTYFASAETASKSEKKTYDPEDDDSSPGSGVVDARIDLTDTVTVPKREIEPIFASAGLTFRPAYEEDKFIGYEVIENASDSRFSVGDIVVQVGDEKLTSLPVDGEYFMAMIANESAILEIRRK